MASNALSVFLQAHKAEKGGVITHTRIGDKGLNIFGGAYNVPDAKYEEFMRLYFNAVIQEGELEYLTEKQLSTSGGICVDFDFRYPNSITLRQHTDDHVIDCIMLYAYKIGQLLQVPDAGFDVYVLHKKDVNVLENKTKDGIHIIFAVQLSKVAQVLLRKMVLPQLKELCTDLPLTNDWENIIDEGVVKGFVNWQMFGSRKPAHQVYMLTQHYHISFKKGEAAECLPCPLLEKGIDFATFLALSARFTGHPAYPATEEANVVDALEKVMGEMRLTSKGAAKSEVAVAPASVACSSAPLSAASTIDKHLALIFDVIKNEKDAAGGHKIGHTQWLSICAFLKSNGYPMEMFIQYCALARNGGTGEKTWKSLNIRFATPFPVLYAIAKVVNPLGWKEWQLKHKSYLSLKVLDRGENDVAKYIAPFLSETLVFSEKRWWIYDEKTKLWRDGVPSAQIASAIQSHIDTAKESLSHVITQTADETKKAELRKKDADYAKCYREVCKGSYLSQVEKFLKEYLLVAEFAALLDVLPYKLPFRNGMLDLKTTTFRVGLTSADYLTTYIGYDYEEGKAADIAWVRKEIKKICNYNEEHLEFYLSSLGYALTADPSRHPFFWNVLGQLGSNGKSKILEVLTTITGNKFVKKVEHNIFEKDQSASLHKQVAEWGGVRLLWLNELDGKKVQDEQVIKNVCDGTRQGYKVMYGTSSSMKIQFKTWFVTNNTLSINGENAVARRINTMVMESEFRADVTEDDFVNRKFKMDPAFGTKLETIFKHALMSLIFQYSKAFVDDGYALKPYPADWSQENQDVMEDNNKFAPFFETHFVVQEGASVFKADVDAFCKEHRMNIKFKDELKKKRVKFTYDSQKRGTGDDAGKKGCFYGLRLKEGANDGANPSPPTYAKING